LGGRTGASVMGSGSFGRKENFGSGFNAGTPSGRRPPTLLEVEF
jgi:hypothetical protein